MATYLLWTIRAVADQPCHAVGLVREVDCEDGVDVFGRVVLEEMLKVEGDVVGGLIAEAFGDGGEDEGEEGGEEEEVGEHSERGGVGL